MDTRRIIENFLETKGIKNCPLCNTNGWNLSEDLFATVPFLKEKKEIAISPAIQIICDNCGFIAQLSATNIGLIPPQK